MTISSMTSVSLPVNVFCWLGWYEQMMVLSPSAGTSTPCPNGRAPPNAQQPATSLIGKPAEGEEHPHAGQQFELALEIGTASVAFLRRGPVLGRGALDGGRHPYPDGPQAVVSRDALRLAGQAGSPECRPQPVAGTVPGKDPPGPVAPVGGRRQANHGQPGRMVTKTRNGPSPILLPRIGGTTFRRHLFPPGDQPGAPPAVHNRRTELVKLVVAHVPRLLGGTPARLPVWPWGPGRPLRPVEASFGKKCHAAPNLPP